MAEEKQLTALEKIKARDAWATTQIEARGWAWSLEGDCPRFPNDTTQVFIPIRFMVGTRPIIENQPRIVKLLRVPLEEIPTKHYSMCDGRHPGLCFDTKCAYVGIWIHVPTQPMPTLTDEPFFLVYLHGSVIKCRTDDGVHAYEYTTGKLVATTKPGENPVHPAYWYATPFIITSKQPKYYEKQLKYDKKYPDPNPLEEPHTHYL